MVAGERESDLSQIAVNANNIPDDTVDCGIRSLRWCSGPTCQKYARLRTFMVFLTIAGILQGACDTYFRISAKQAALENGYNPIVVDWLIVSSGIFQAILALGYAHWANKLHPTSWLGGTIMLQGVACIIAVIPSIMNFSDGTVAASQTVDSNLCATTLPQLQQRLTLSAEQSKWIILVLLFTLQFMLGLGSLAFYTVGITYLDDNSLSIDSPAVIATTLGARMFGFQVGSALVLGVGATSVGWWLGWAILGPIVFISGLLLSLFPKRLPKTVIHQAAQRIIEETRIHQFGSQISTYIDDPDFVPSLKRLFSNKLLMFNLMSIMFIYAAFANYSLQEESYLQSRFFLPYSEEDGLMQEWKARFVSYFLEPPVAAVAMFIAGLVISKLKLTGRKITAINIGMGVKLVLIYVAFIFIKCDVGPIAGITGGKLTQPYCSSQCICAPQSFSPVCPENSTVTYFSACYAGCTQKTVINNIELYEGCSCGNNVEVSWTSMRATEGACSADTCNKKLIVFQVLSILAAGMLGITVIGKIIITLRSVLPQDKGLALAFQVMFSGFFAFVPVHLAYDVVTRSTCIYWAPQYSRCLLRETPKHGNILNILTASLILVGVLFDILVFIFIKGLNLYNCKVTDSNYTPALYREIPHEQHERIPLQQAISPGESSPNTTLTTASSPMQRRDTTLITKPAPTEPLKPAINLYRNPSSLTSSSAGENSLIDPATGVTYAQVVFPPDKRKTNDGSSSPKRMAVRADVPTLHLSSQDVRTQLGNLKSFDSEKRQQSLEEQAVTPLTVNTSIANKPGAATGAIPKTPVTTNLDAIRPQSPETDF